MLVMSRLLAFIAIGFAGLLNNLAGCAEPGLTYVRVIYYIWFNNQWLTYNSHQANAQNALNVTQVTLYSVGQIACVNVFVAPMLIFTKMRG
jgi:hypothetical protein